MSDSIETPAWNRSIDAISLFTENLEQTKEFYERVFGLPVHFEDSNSADFKFGNTFINLLRTSEASELIEPAKVAVRCRSPLCTHNGGRRCGCNVCRVDQTWSRSNKWPNGSTLGYPYSQLYGPCRPHLGDCPITVKHSLFGDNKDGSYS
jgi:hypothetical protein